VSKSNYNNRIIEDELKISPIYCI